MKLLLAVALVVTAVCSVKAVCPEINGCSSCTNRGVLCEICPAGTVLSQDRTSCLDCGDSCLECESDADDVVTCLVCMVGSYLKDGACNECATGCQECHEDETGAVHCEVCYENSYVIDAASATGECIACDNNCKTCSLNEDGSTTCSECYSYVGLGIRGYFLDKEDKSCKSCPSNCEKCSDDGEGNGLCGTCFTNYLALVDEDDSTNDKTKCVRCPTECSACTGVEYSSGVATCTGCVDGEGNYIDSGACVSCDDHCTTCNDDGDCETCETGYRVDDGSCIECPAFCDSCSVDDTSGEDVCAECEEEYGTKEHDTCDVCTTPNCRTCSRLADGSMTCSACKDGYGYGSDGDCTACPTGCLTCSYSTDHMKCTDCEEGYADSVYPASGASTSADPSRCLQCPTACETCIPDGAGDVNCTACVDDDTHYVDESQNPAVCENLPNNCETASLGTCDTCKDGFYNNSGSCDACTASLNCATCNYDSSKCLTCNDGFGMIDTDLDNETEACEACGISNCNRCFAEAGYQGNPKKCWECKTGYVIYDADTESTLYGAGCKKCPTGCTTCTVDYNDNDKTKCTSGGCTTWDGSKAYTDGETGTCEQCSSNCKACTYDSDEETTTCDDGQCDTGYQKNVDGECEACPEHCEACELNDDDEIVCTDGQCETGYGNDADGGCSACPTNCDDCSLTGETDDTDLHCDDCADGYVLNDDVCGACPSNCVSCVDELGSMTCTECDDEYALDSSKSCVRCATNCEECSASKCTQCKSGYGLSVDGLTCVDCSEAAFENCALCGNINSDSGHADCIACASGYALEDMAANKSCVDAGSLDCGSGTYADKPAECDTCEDGFDLTDDYQCAISCYACGDVEAGVYVSSDLCTIPSGNASAGGENMATLIPCTNGVCYGAWLNDLVMGGCMPSASAECAVGAYEGETCETAFDDKRCERCCDSSECNTWLPDMDGIPDSATAITINMLLISMAAAIVALF